MQIIPYQEKYRDDMIFMVLEAKDALGRVLRLNDDLLDIQGAYLDRGDMFWLALDERDRVVGAEGAVRVAGHQAVLFGKEEAPCVGHPLCWLRCWPWRRAMPKHRGKRRCLFTWVVRSTAHHGAFTRSMGMWKLCRTV